MVKMKKVATYAIASAMIACAGISTGNIGVQAATKTPVTKAKVSYHKMMSLKDYNKFYEDYMSQFLKAPEVTNATFDHGYIITRNVLNVTFTAVDHAKSYDVMISKDNNFKTTKIYTTDKTSLSVSTDDDDFLTPAWHGRYVKVRANYGYGIRSKWSEAEMIGCGKLHLHQDFNNLTSK